MEVVKMVLDVLVLVLNLALIIAIIKYRRKENRHVRERKGNH